MTDLVQHLEAERLRPVPPLPSPRDDAMRMLLALIAGECHRAGYLPPDWRPRG